MNRRDGPEGTGYGPGAPVGNPWDNSRNSFNRGPIGGYERPYFPTSSGGTTPFPQLPGTHRFGPPPGLPLPIGPQGTGFPGLLPSTLPAPMLQTVTANSVSAAFGSRQSMHLVSSTTAPPGLFGGPHAWDPSALISPTDSVDDIIASPNLSDYSPDNSIGSTVQGGLGHGDAMSIQGKSQRRPSNRDEFDGPHQFLQRPPPEYVALQERELPHLPTNLHVQEQDGVLTMVNERLARCAFDFVAKYQFPIPLTPDMRPVERPQDREWSEWVYLLKRLATKRRIPARVLYNGQIKQLVTILENSLEMRHAAKNQSRPLKDDRNILQLISAGIQVAKILKDASAMDYLDKLYVSTERQIHERTAARFDFERDVGQRNHFFANS